MVRLRVGADGSVQSVELAEGIGHGLDRRALEIARSFRFEPARDALGRAVAALVEWRFKVGG